VTTDDEMRSLLTAAAVGVDDLPPGIAESVKRRFVRRRRARAALAVTGAAAAAAAITVVAGGRTGRLPSADELTVNVTSTSTSTSTSSSTSVTPTPTPTPTASGPLAIAPSTIESVQGTPGHESLAVFDFSTRRTLRTIPLPVGWIADVPDTDTTGHAFLALKRLTDGRARIVRVTLSDGRVTTVADLPRASAPYGSLAVSDDGARVVVRTLDVSSTVSVVDVRDASVHPVRAGASEQVFGWWPTSPLLELWTGATEDPLRLVDISGHVVRSIDLRSACSVTISHGHVFTWQGCSTSHGTVTEITDEGVHQVATIDLPPSPRIGVGALTDDRRLLLFSITATCGNQDVVVDVTAGTVVSSGCVSNGGSAQLPL
jgi:hypothetical protein